MAARSRYLLVYDIRKPRRLRRVHEVAKRYGYPLQYSVFVCDLTKAEKTLLRGALVDEIDLVVDSVAIFDLGPARARAVECVDYLGVARDVGHDGPHVW